MKLCETIITVNRLICRHRFSSFRSKFKVGRSAHVLVFLSIPFLLYDDGSFCITCNVHISILIIIIIIIIINKHFSTRWYLIRLRLSGSIFGSALCSVLIAYSSEPTNDVSNFVCGRPPYLLPSIIPKTNDLTFRLSFTLNICLTVSISSVPFPEIHFCLTALPSLSFIQTLNPIRMLY